MFIYSGNRPFNIDFIFDYSLPATLFDSEDVSGGTLLSSIIEKNKNQLSVFRQLCFRDSETQTLLVQGTQELIRNLEKLKRFLKTKENTKT
jgi:hypothetical protein